MKLLYDRRYPVTSILLLVTTAVFLSMFIRFGGDYQTGAAIAVVSLERSFRWIQARYGDCLLLLLFISD